jgi:hypothetical protein
MEKEKSEFLNKSDGRKTVSYSQLSMYNSCNFKWYLSYVKKLSSYEGNIHVLFGSAMHETLQTYLTTMFSDGISKADSIDLNKLLVQSMISQFEEIQTKSGKAPCNAEDLKEFLDDGIAILEFFKKHRGDYFTNNGCELVGVEIPLKVDMMNNTRWVSFLDIVIRNIVSKKIKIIDLKTSTNGWKDYKKKDDNTNAQLIIYKKFYSELFDIPLEDIDVEFIILKRKLYENVDYPQKRIQVHAPLSGPRTVTKHVEKIYNFVRESFNQDGTYNTDREYSKNPGKPCDWCEFSGNHCKH